MPRMLLLIVPIAMPLMVMSAPTFAQNGTAAGAQIGIAPGTGGVPPVGVTPPPTGSSVTTGINTSGVNQPGVPNTSTPGTFGTGATPSGLPGDDPAHPGFPAKVGR